MPRRRLLGLNGAVPLVWSSAEAMRTGGNETQAATHANSSLVRRGFAARREARLCLAVGLFLLMGLCPCSAVHCDQGAGLRTQRKGRSFS
jgi:hypothetical protein